MLSVQQIAHLAWERAAPLCFNCEEFILCCLSLQSKHVDFGNVWFEWWALNDICYIWNSSEGSRTELQQEREGVWGRGGDLGRDGFEGTQSQMKTRPGEKERTEEEGERLARPCCGWLWACAYLQSSFLRRGHPSLDAHVEEFTVMEL